MDLRAAIKREERNAKRVDQTPGQTERRPGRSKSTRRYDQTGSVLASRPGSYSRIEPDFHLLAQLFWLPRRLSLCFLPVSKLIDGSIGSLHSFAQSV